VQQTQSTEIYGGIKSNIGKHISFDGKLSWWQYNGLPIFINDTAGDKKQFLLLYDQVNAIGLQAAIRYHIAETFSVGFSGQWMNFVKKSSPEVWHRPGVMFKGDVLAMPLKKLTINAYISFIDELYALDNGNRTLKLSSILDIGAGAEYEIIKRLNVFVQANNLLNSKYQRWYGYDAFGLNIFAGARLKF
jgi:outer membrane receptor protein involved in Fe transport